MASDPLVDLLKESLAAGERLEDFTKLVDILTELRRPFHATSKLEVIRRIGAGILCALVFGKPEPARAAMQRFRLEFKGVAEDVSLQLIFANCVLPAALLATEEMFKEASVFVPSRFFDPTALARARSPERYVQQVQDGLPTLEGWF